jgi:hypothetical protein
MLHVACMLRSEARAVAGSSVHRRPPMLHQASSRIPPRPSCRCKLALRHGPEPTTFRVSAGPAPPRPSFSCRFESPPLHPVALDAVLSCVQGHVLRCAEAQLLVCAVGHAVGPAVLATATLAARAWASHPPPPQPPACHSSLPPPAHTPPHTRASLVFSSKCTLHAHTCLHACTHTHGHTDASNHAREHARRHARKSGEWVLLGTPRRARAKCSRTSCANGRTPPSRLCDLDPPFDSQRACSHQCGAHTHAHMHTCTPASTHTHTHTCTQTRMPARKHSRPHACTHAHTHTRGGTAHLQRVENKLHCAPGITAFTVRVLHAPSPPSRPVPSPPLPSPRLPWPLLASPRLASPGLASPGLPSPGLLSPPLASSRLASPRLASPRLLPSQISQCLTAAVCRCGRL